MVQGFWNLQALRHGQVSEHLSDGRAVRQGQATVTAAAGRVLGNRGAAQSSETTVCGISPVMPRSRHLEGKARSRMCAGRRGPEVGLVGDGVRRTALRCAAGRGLICLPISVDGVSQYRADLLDGCGCCRQESGAPLPSAEPGDRVSRNQRESPGETELLRIAGPCDGASLRRRVAGAPCSSSIETAAPATRQPRRERTPCRW